MQASSIVVRVRVRNKRFDSFFINLHTRILILCCLIPLFLLKKSFIFVSIRSLNLLKLLGSFSPLLSQSFFESKGLFLLIQFLKGFLKSDRSLIVKLLLSFQLFCLLNTILLLFNCGEFIWFFLILFSLLFKNLQVLQLLFLSQKLGF